MRKPKVLCSHERDGVNKEVSEPQATRAKQPCHRDGRANRNLPLAHVRGSVTRAIDCGAKYLIYFLWSQTFIEPVPRFDQA